MNKQSRNESGQFVPKSSEYRMVRSLRVTDAAWTKLGQVAEKRGMTRADLLERMAECDELNVSLQAIKDAIAKIIDDPQVTRNGKDRGSVKRALEALLRCLN